MSEVIKNEIVISGMSGRFPEANNVEKFKQNLLEGKDMITEDNSRWQPEIYDLPPRFGKIKDLALCDATFFEISPKQAHVMDPGLRMLLEVTYEALVDAGISPRELRGSNTGVFMAGSTSETEMQWFTKLSLAIPLCILSCSRTMLANQISYVFDFKGPSYVSDTACSSSITALDQAISAIKLGHCDAAIVGGCNLLLFPGFSHAFNQLGVLSADGKCKAFDQNANGYARAESVAVIFLQKAKDARRCYATILGIKTNSDGYKNEDISFPSELMKMQLYKELYNNCNIDPLRVGYVEAHGTGTLAGDPEETNSIAHFFCKNRKEPLLVGSVKSNMGHAEIASGLCSIIKSIIMFETLTILKNLHYKNPNKKIPYLLEGKLKVVTENKSLNTEIIAVNSTGLGGTNGHVVLKINSKQKCLSLKDTSADTIPYIVGVSGRTEEAVNELLNLAEKHKNDEEFLTLMNFAHHKFTPRHGYRGYLILNSRNEKVISKAIPNKRPIWFIISGMGCQWPGMGNALMQFEVFRNSIKQSAMMLKKYKVDIEKYLFNSNKTDANDALTMFVAIESFQVALIDLLKHIGIEPDGFIGHSFGEICCAYVDGLLTAEEAVLCAYYRGLAGIETKIPLGAMAVVNLSAEEVEKLCSPTVFVACDNSADNVTISGPIQDVDRFIEELTSKNIIAHKIKSYNTAYHSKYVANAAPILQNYLKKLIPSSKQRSTKWISTSVPESEWKTTKANFSAEYYVNNFVSPVLFRQALKHVPENAITIEIAATTLFRSILSKSIGSNSIDISPVKESYTESTEFFLWSLGNFYNAGGEPAFDALYPKIEFPVSRGTPMIGPAVKWDHTAKWTVVDYYDHLSLADATIVHINMNDHNDSYLAGHRLNNKIVFPGTGFVNMVWKSFSSLKKKNFLKTPIVIENFELKKVTVLSESSKIKFCVNICTATGEFSISESDSIVAKGKIRELNDSDEPINIDYKNVNKISDNILLTTEDVYQELSLRGYQYDGLFKSVLECDIYNASSKVRWNNNWVTFLDGMLHLLITQTTCDNLYYLFGIQEIIINPQQHLEFVNKFRINQGIPVKFDFKKQKLISGGVQFTKVDNAIAPKHKIATDNLILERYELVPYDNSNLLSTNIELCEKNILKVMSQIVLENTKRTKIDMLELILNDSDKCVLSENVLSILNEETQVPLNATIASKIDLETKLINSSQFAYIELDPTLEKIDKPVDLVIVNNVDNLNQEILLENIKNNINPRGFLLLKNTKTFLKKNVGNLEPIATQSTNDKTYQLFRNLENTADELIMVKIDSDNFDWISELQNAMQTNEANNKKMLLYNYGNNPNGLIGFVNCLKLEPFCQNVRSVFMYDQMFDIELCKDQLKKDLVHNVYKNGQWGSYRHLLLEYQNKNHKVPVENAYLDALVSGDLSSLTWFETSPYMKGNTVKDNYAIHYAALNFRDVMLALGKAAGQNIIKHCKGLSIEFSGLNKKGARVMGIGEPALGKHLLHLSGVWDVPNNWTLEEASTVPFVYLTSYFALIVKGKLQKNESVLIHSGAGGTGLAALTIAFSLDCEVFTTVGSETKKNVLLNRFPKLKECNIGNSRNKSFEELIFVNTEGKGVDVVLNSLSGNLLQASIRCLSDRGRFLELGKTDLLDNSSLPMRTMTNSISFITVALNVDFMNPSSDLEIAKKLLNDGIKSGVVKPLPFKIFDISKVEDAFRLLASGKSIGKVVINMRYTERKPIIAISKSFMNPLSSFIIIGGLGGFGLELAKWLIKKGAKNIVLVSRIGVVSGYQALCLKKWRQTNINIEIFTQDVSTKNGATSLIEAASLMGKIDGIFNLAVLLKDAIFKNQSKLTFEEACKCKVNITKNLDDISRKLVPDLKYFVVFSSYACGRGAPGLSNYAYGNSVIERICENRRENGFHGLAIQWGVIGDVGVVARRSDKDKIIKSLASQSIFSCLQLMNVFLKESAPIVCSAVRQSTQSTSKDNNSLDITSAVANIFGITEIDQISKLLSLTHLGINSLMLSEIKLLLAERFNIRLTSAEIRNLTFEQLQEFHLKKTSINKTSKNNSNNFN